MSNLAERLAREAWVHKVGPTLHPVLLDPMYAFEEACVEAIRAFQAEAVKVARDFADQCADYGADRAAAKIIAAALEAL
jgi:hypothetical protein